MMNDTILDPVTEEARLFEEKGRHTEVTVGEGVINRAKE
jgi:hypothetical protein